MPRQKTSPTLYGFDPYGNQNRLLPRPLPANELCSHFLGTAAEWVQIDNWDESFYLYRFDTFWELRSGSGLLCRANAENLTAEFKDVGELLLTQLWCIRWPVAVALTGCDDPGELGDEAWSRIKLRYDEHLSANWTPERVDYVLAAKEQLRKAFWDNAPGKVWAVKTTSKSDISWCAKNANQVHACRSDNGREWILEFDNSDHFADFCISSPARAGLEAWIQHPDGRVQEVVATA